MTAISLPRRVMIAVISLGLAAGFFHGQLASALVTRGDDAARNGDRTAAIRYYSRALVIDRHAARAADRLAFALSLRRAPGDEAAAITVASAALTALPNDPALLADRGFAEQRLGRWVEAERDFDRAGTSGHDARYAHLAARLALRRGDTDRARELFGSALADDPTFDPARVALARLRR